MDEDQPQGDVPAGVDVGGLTSEQIHEITDQTAQLQARINVEVPEEEPPDPYSGIPTQDECDVAVLRGSLVEERKELALVKLRWTVAQRLGLKGTHPQTLAKDALEHTERIELICELLDTGAIAGPGKAAAELVLPVNTLKVPEPKVYPTPAEAKAILQNPDGA